MFTNVKRRLTCLLIILVCCPTLVSAQWIDIEHVVASSSIPLWLYPAKNPTPSPPVIYPSSILSNENLNLLSPRISYTNQTGNEIDFGTLKFENGSLFNLSNTLLCLRIDVSTLQNINSFTLNFPDLLFIENKTIPGTFLKVAQSNVVGSLKINGMDLYTSKKRYNVGFSLNLSDYLEKYFVKILFISIGLYCTSSGNASKTIRGSFDLNVGELLYPFTWKIRITSS